VLLAVLALASSAGAQGPTPNAQRPTPTAAPAIGTETRRPRVAAYNTAARDAGIGEWGDTARNRGVTQVLLRMEGRQLTVTIALPPSITPAAANAWFGQLPGRMGWRSFSLFANRQPGGLFMRAVVSDAVRQSGFGRSVAVVDLEKLRQEIRRISPAPAIVAARLPQTDVIALDPLPSGDARGSIDRFLFYRLSALPAGAAVLRVEFGVSTRWFAAAGVGLAMWLIFPIAALLAVRDRLARQKGTEPKERLTSFRRWQNGITFATILGAYATMYMLGLGRLGYLLGTGLAATGPVMFLVPLGTVTLAARLVGLPVERAAFPHRAGTPWYRAAAGELVLLAIMLAVPAVIFALVNAAAGGAPRPNLGNGLFILIFALPVVGIGGAAIWQGIVWRRRKRGSSTDEPDAPEAVTKRIRALTEQLGVPVRRVLVARHGPAVAALAVVVKEDVAVLSGDLAAELTEEQTAALVASQALVAHPSRFDKMLAAGFVALSTLPLLAMLPLILSLSAGGRPSRAGMPFVLLFAMLLPLFGVFTQRRGMQLQEEADLRVAEVTGDPRCLLDAIRKMEEIQSALVLTQSRSNRRYSTPGMRLARLQQRLGLD